MRIHSEDFKNQIKELGKEQEIRITYADETLDGESIYEVNYFVNGGLLKSIMKGLEIESIVDIPLNTEIKLEYGLKVNGAYEYIDMGNYIIIESEKQEDSSTYKLKAYDKMINSMKTYESLGIDYPITVDNYIKNLCSRLNIPFKESTYANMDKLIKGEVYTAEFTYRDILDDLAEVTASMIAIDNNGQLEIRYPNETSDIIDEEYLKDINVNFGKKYGVINSIVLSRSAGSDNVYLKDNESILENGLCEIKIEDNMIMNDNDRATFLPDILSKLGGMEFYLNDFSSTGIVYFEPYDMYMVSIDGNYYNCLMLNDEINISQGLEEIIYTEEPQVSETDYSKADKTDQKINQTYLIVDKQNQTITSVVSNVDGQNQRLSQVEQNVAELNSKITDIADITTSAESMYGKVTLEQINESEPIYMNIRPNGVNISYLYPSNNLYPGNDLFCKTRSIQFKNTKTNEIIDYELPNDLLYYNEQYYDEFIFSYEGQVCQVNKKCGYDADGNVVLLASPSIINYDFPTIALSEGDYEVSVLNYNLAYIQVKLMASNIYTSQFATKVEMNSEISQTAEHINLSVDKKLTNYSTTNEMNSAISIKANEITSSVNNTFKNYSTTSQMNSAISQSASSVTSSVTTTLTNNMNNTLKNYSTTTQMNSTIKQTADSINSTVSKKVGYNEIISKINQSPESVSINANKISLYGKTLNLSADNTAITSNNFSVNTNGDMFCSNANINGGKIRILGSDTSDDLLRVEGDNGVFTYIQPGGIGLVGSQGRVDLQSERTNQSSYIAIRGNRGYTSLRDAGITTPYVEQTSLESKKKNITLYDENALKLIKNSEIYTYNFKTDDYKHIGFVIGDEGGNYKTPEEVIGMNGNGIDTYNMISILWKATQEQQELIEKLQDEINKLKGGKENG